MYHKGVVIMNMEQQLHYLGMTYTIISAEQEFVIHPVVGESVPITVETIKCPFSCSFHLDNYSLMLDNITLYKDNTLRKKKYKLNIDRKNEIMESHDICGDFKVGYSGAVLIGSSLIKDFRWDSNQTACFSYKNVYELVFKEGTLITTIDHCKEMLRIRKNIELEYRSMTKKHDVRVIKRFLNTSFVGDYKPFLTSYKRAKYLREMKKNYARGIIF